MSALTCDCEVYEMCPTCAPSPEEFARVNELRDEVLKSHEAVNCLNTRYPEYGECETCGSESRKIGIAADLDHFRRRMALFVTEVSPHDPTAYTIPFETYLRWELRQQRERNADD